MSDSGTREEAERRQKERAELRERFRKALTYRTNRDDVERILKEWAEVDDESARRLDDLP